MKNAWQNGADRRDSSMLQHMKIERIVYNGRSKNLNPLPASTTAQQPITKQKY
jgi:hypothetical protein